MAMKTGLEDKKKVAIAVVLAVVVLFLVLRMAFQMMGGGSAPPSKLPPRIANGSAPAQTTQPSQTNGTEHEAVKISANSMAKLDPTLHPEWMAAAESMRYKGTGRNIFSMSSTPVAIEKPIGPVRPNAQQAAAAQGPVGPPPIDLKFFGFEAHDGGTRKAFLLHGDDVFIASEGDVVDHRYKVVQIAPMSIQIQDLPYNDTQTLPLIQN